MQNLCFPYKREDRNTEVHVCPRTLNYDSFFFFVSFFSFPPCALSALSHALSYYVHTLLR